MTAFFFGERRRPLYGVYHPAIRSSVSARAAVLCYPMADEYLRSHRAFRQVANALARAGVHALRFDYSGTGNSWGGGEDVSVSRWLEDIDLAVAELQDMSGVGRVSLIGLQLGATLAALCAGSARGVDRLVLWDPVLDCREFVANVIEEGGGSKSFSAPPGASCPALSANGFAFSESLAAELGDLDLSPLRQLSVEGVYVIASNDTQREAVTTALGSKGGPVQVHRAGASSWGVGDGLASSLLDADVVRTIVNCFAAEDDV